MEKAQLEAEVKGLGKVYLIERPFDESLNALKEQNAKIVSGRDLAYARITQGAKDHVSTYGSYIKQGFLYVPKKGLSLVAESPILASSEKATNCHRNGKEFYPTSKQVEKALAKSVKVPYDLTAVPTNRFGENEVTVFLFEDLAEKYGGFLREHCRINEMPVYKLSKSDVDSQKKPFARQAWLHRVDDGWSDLGGNGRVLYYSYAVRGVQKETAEGGSQKIQTYTETDIKNVLRTLKLEGLEGKVLETLREKH